MTQEQVKCPQCGYEYPYLDGENWICSDCNHTWNPSKKVEVVVTKEVIRDANGNELKDGDSVTVIRDLKVKGSSNSIKVGTKVKNIRLLEDAVDGHNIACRIDGFGAMDLKSEVVKKIT